MSSDGRAHPRYAHEVDADVRLHDRRFPARTKDVSKGGLCFVTDASLALGQEVAISMALVFDEETFSEPLDVRARVVWCTPLGAKFQIGTTFLGLTNENRAYLDMFLRYLKEGLARHREPPDDDGEMFG